MRQFVLIGFLIFFPFLSVLADEKKENTAKEFLVIIFSGDIKSSVGLSGIPFSYDRRTLVKSLDALKVEFAKIVKQNGSTAIELTSIQELLKSRGVHKDLKEDITIYEIGIKMNKSEVKLQVFIRKSDGKVVGLYG